MIEVILRCQSISLKSNRGQLGSKIIKPVSKRTPARLRWQTTYLYSESHYTLNEILGQNINPFLSRGLILFLRLRRLWPNATWKNYEKVKLMTETCF